MQFPSVCVSEGAMICVYGSLEFGCVLQKGIWSLDIVILCQLGLAERGYGSL